MSDNNHQKYEKLEIGFYLILGIMMVGILPLFIGLGLLGFEESFIEGQPLTFGSLLANYIIYIPFVIIALSVIIFPIMNLLLIRKGQHPATQENPTWWRIFTVSLIHSPENGALYTLFRKMGLGRKQNYMNWSLSILRLFAISTIVFASFGTLSLIFPEAQVVGIPNTVFQQVTPFTEVLFTAEPPAFSETGTMLFVLFLLLGLNAYFVSKFKLGIATFFMIAILFITPVIGFGWMSLHNIVYAGSDQARFATFIFGFFGSLMTILVGSFIPWYSWHFWNNVYAKLNQIVPANEDVIFLSVVFIGIFAIFYMGFEFLNWKNKRKKQLEPSEPTF